MFIIEREIFHFKTLKYPATFNKPMMKVKIIVYIYEILCLF